MIRFTMFLKIIAKGAMLMLALGASGTSALDILGGHDISSGEEFEDHLAGHYRELAGAEELCIDGTTKTYYFEVTIRLVPGEDTGICLLADQVLLGHDINLLLLDYGIGAAGADDDAIFLAGVCPQPTSTSERRELLQRELWRGGYIWKGGGGCRGCFSDNRDGRNLQLGSIEGSSQANWFSDQYAPWLETTVENAIAQDVAPNHADCLGASPREVEVTITEIHLSDLELGCDDGTVIETLQSLSLSDEPLRDRTCDKCSSIDFSTYTSNGAAQIAQKGDYVSDEWKVEHGLTISASGGYNPGFKARIFDTGDQSCVNSANDSLEFGSPNKNCQTSGLGDGDGGNPGEAGENCEPVGNVLIVQESDKPCPDSNPEGGTLKFVFDTPVLVSDIGLMDVDEDEQRIKITYDDGVSELFAYSGFGNNAVQRVICNKLNVKVLEVILPGTGAVTELNFCPECRPLNRAYTTATNCLTTGSGGDITGVEEIAFDDFEGSVQSVALDGWSNAQWDRSGQQGFSQFLGRYVRGMASPYKVYEVPIDAEKVTFEIDFYEIDSWDSGPNDLVEWHDQVDIYVDGERLALGTFFNLTSSSGESKHGISWKARNLTESDYIGFAGHKDQKHRIEIEVPATTGLMKDGRLRLTLAATLTSSDLENESAGWDNIRVKVHHGCSHTAPVQSCDKAVPQFISGDNFEGTNPLTGWTNGRLEASERNGAFTAFLGRYGKNELSPYKTFDVPTTAQVIIIELDFYEIDTWNQVGIYGPDVAAVYVDNVKIDLGAFGANVDEGYTNSTLANGVFFEKDSLTERLAMGFGPKVDQKHRVRIEVPKSSGLFDDGKLTLKLEVGVSQGFEDESGGWDNIKVLSKSSCSL